MEQAPQDSSQDRTDDRSYDPAAEVVQLCQDLIRIDTSNYGTEDGPGERKAAEHVAALLDEVGIGAEVIEGRPGRANVLARWGGGDGRAPLLLHGHLDVVPAEASDWKVDPFAGEIQDGQVWGRGAVDMKDFDAMLLSVVRARAAAGAAPDREVVLCFTADEEAAATTVPGSSWTSTPTGSPTARRPSARSVASPPRCADAGSTSSRPRRRAWPGCASPRAAGPGTAR